MPLPEKDVVSAKEVIRELEASVSYWREQTRYAQELGDHWRLEWRKQRQAVKELTDKFEQLSEKSVAK